MSNKTDHEFLNSDDEFSNTTTNPSFHDVLNVRLSRRDALKVGLGALVASAFGMNPAFADGHGAKTAEEAAQAVMEQAATKLGFKSVPVADLVDDVVVPEGYSAKIFYAWGDPVSDGAAFKMDASNTADEQAQQAGMHHDAISFFPLPAGAKDSDHGLLVMNHEYIDPQILHTDGGAKDDKDNYTPEKTLKEQNAHGVSVIEVKKDKGEWAIVRPSKYARRITANTAMDVSGVAAGSDYLKTAADKDGMEILGTLNNCANGVTPWGTYLTCEENFRKYFAAKDADVSDAQKDAWKRYGVKKSSYGWEINDDRFDAAKTPNEPNRFGWIVEFDPYNPESKPVKRTALGRFAHENVADKVAADGRVAFYSGDDARFEYVYKFVTAKPMKSDDGVKNGALLDDGTLYVAKFNDDGSGEWIALTHGEGELTKENGFADQADVLVRTRMAADAVGATPMDRPEWIDTHPKTGDVYVTMTNNSKRGKDDKPGKDASNPRDKNIFGHIVKLMEKDAADASFKWDVFAMAGLPDSDDANKQGNINGDIYANPDGIWFDDREVMWVQTDISGSKQNSGDFKAFGNNQMVAIDTDTGETRRFLTGPVGCEVTGVTMSPDMKTMWVNIQHPGDVPPALADKGVEKSPEKPNAASNWPNHQKEGGRPRSGTVMITRDDGGVIGA